MRSVDMDNRIKQRLLRHKKRFQQRRCRSEQSFRPIVEQKEQSSESNSNPDQQREPTVQRNVSANVASSNTPQGTTSSATATATIIQLRDRIKRQVKLSRKELEARKRKKREATQEPPPKKEDEDMYDHVWNLARSLALTRISLPGSSTANDRGPTGFCHADVSMPQVPRQPPAFLHKITSILQEASGSRTSSKSPRKDAGSILDGGGDHSWPGSSSEKRPSISFFTNPPSSSRRGKKNERTDPLPFLECSELNSFLDDPPEATANLGPTKKPPRKSKTRQRLHRKHKESKRNSKPSGRNQQQQKLVDLSSMRCATLSELSTMSDDSSHGG